MRPGDRSQGTDRRNVRACADTVAGAHQLSATTRVVRQNDAGTTNARRPTTSGWDAAVLNEIPRNRGDQAESRQFRSLPSDLRHGPLKDRDAQRLPRLLRLVHTPTGL